MVFPRILVSRMIKANCVGFAASRACKQTVHLRPNRRQVAVRLAAPPNAPSNRLLFQGRCASPPPIGMAAVVLALVFQVDDHGAAAAGMAVLGVSVATVTGLYLVNRRLERRPQA